MSDASALDASGGRPADLADAGVVGPATERHRAVECSAPVVGRALERRPIGGAGQVARARAKTHVRSAT